MHQRFKGLVFGCAVVTALVGGSGVGAQALPFLLFERYLDPLRLQLGIPGLVAVIAQDGQPIWESALGFRDIERSERVRPDTPFPIADLTQTITATLLLHCVERGEVALDAPIGNWVPNADPADATLTQLLSHAAPEVVTGFRYAPARFALLARPVEACFDAPFRRVVAHEVFDHLAMGDAVPGHDIADVAPELRALFQDAKLEQYAAALARMATPYRVDRRGRATRADLPSAAVDGAHGLIASARDLVKFDAAIADHLRPETVALGWTNVSHNGLPTPFGLGWFVQTYNGEKTRVALWPLPGRVLVAHPQSARPADDLDSSRQQRRSQRALLAQRRRRHELTLCPHVPPPVPVGGA